MMRAKMYVTNIDTVGVGIETVCFACVTDKPFTQEGDSEDNTFAKWSPSGTLSITITNPALVGKFHCGQKFCLDFTESPDSPATVAATTTAS